jgi:hypothetical protein
MVLGMGLKEAVVDVIKEAHLFQLYFELPGKPSTCFKKRFNFPSLFQKNFVFISMTSIIKSSNSWILMPEPGGISTICSAHY